MSNAAKNVNIPATSLSVLSFIIINLFHDFIVCRNMRHL